MGRGMCAVCDVEDDVAASHAFLPKEVLPLVYLTDRQVPGEPAGEKMWEIYFGRENGSIPWAQFERMRLCHKAALDILADRANIANPGVGFRLQRGPRRPAGPRKLGLCSE